MNLEMETFQVFWIKSAIWCEGQLFDVRKKDFFGTRGSFQGQGVDKCWNSTAFRHSL